MWRIEFLGYWFVSYSDEFKGNTIYIHGANRLILSSYKLFEPLWSENSSHSFIIQLCTFVLLDPFFIVRLFTKTKAGKRFQVVAS